MNATAPPILRLDVREARLVTTTVVGLGAHVVVSVSTAVMGPGELDPEHLSGRAREGEEVRCFGRRRRYLEIAAGDEVHRLHRR